LKNYIDVKEYIRTNNLVINKNTSDTSHTQTQEKPQQQEVVQVNTKPQPEAIVQEFTDIELTNMRKVIAKRLTLSKVESKK
jgi:hypothetical protein